MSYSKTAIDAQNTGRIRELVRSLDDSDYIKRWGFHDELEKLGWAATKYLTKALDDPSKRVRWEAAKALGSIKDPSAAPALVNSLMDEVFEIQWLAAEALIALGNAAVVPLLERLITDYQSPFLRQGAHHVLHALERRHLLDPQTQSVMDDLRCIEPLEPFRYRAKRALDSLKEEATQHAISSK